MDWEESPQIDYFSTHIDDCLYSVFRYLDRDNLDKMEIINRRLRSFAKFPKFAKVKRELATIGIIQTEKGHELRVLFDDEGEINDSVFTFEREPMNKEIKGESEATDDNFMITEKHMRCARDTTLSYSKTQDIPPARTHNLPVPRELFKKAAEIMSKNTFIQYKFLNPLWFKQPPNPQFSTHQNGFELVTQVLVDDEFVRNCVETFDGLPITLFIGCENALSPQGVQDFFRWIISSPQFVFLNNNFERCKCVDEKFIKEFVRCRSNNVDLSVSFVHRSFEVIEHATFTPSKDIVEYLPRFYTFTLISMIVETDWLLEAVMARLQNTGEGPEQWIVRVTQRMTDAHFLMQLQQGDQYSLRDNGMQGAFYRKNGKIRIKIVQQNAHLIAFVITKRPV